MIYFLDLERLVGYVDGGSGSMVLQAALAGAFAAAYGLKGVLGRVIGMLRKGPKTHA